MSYPRFSTEQALAFIPVPLYHTCVSFVIPTQAGIHKATINNIAHFMGITNAPSELDKRAVNVTLTVRGQQVIRACGKSNNPGWLVPTMVNVKY